MAAQHQSRGEWEYKPKGVECAPRSGAAVETLAARLRALLGVAPDGYIDMIDVFENLDKYRITVGYQRLAVEFHVTGNMPEGVPGLTRYCATENRIIVEIAEETYEAASENNGRARFTIAHEMGHAALHGEELLNLALLHVSQTGFARGNRTHEAYRDSEWQANRFASAMLAPASGVEAHLTGNMSNVWSKHRAIKAIQDQFKVSREAANIRVSQVLKQRNRRGR